MMPVHNHSVAQFDCGFAERKHYAQPAVTFRPAVPVGKFLPRSCHFRRLHIAYASCPPRLDALRHPSIDLWLIICLNPVDFVLTTLDSYYIISLAMADSTPKSYHTDPTLYLYTSLTAGSSHIITATSRLETILKANRIPFQALDVATDEKARMLWGRRAGKRKLPGLVRMGMLIGVGHVLLDRHGQLIKRHDRI